MRISLEPIKPAAQQYPSWDEAWLSGYRIFKEPNGAVIFIGQNPSFMYYIDSKKGILAMHTDKVRFPLTALLDEKVIFSNCN